MDIFIAVVITVIITVGVIAFVCLSLDHSAARRDGPKN